MLNPRHYQRQAIDATYDYWRRGGGNGLIVLPTGSGKALVIALFIKEIVEQWSARVLCLTHRAELLKQNEDEFLGIWPEAKDRTGIFSASVGRKEIEKPILFAGIQSIEKHIMKLDPPPEIVFIDECHLVSQKDGTRYKSAIDKLKLMYPNLKGVGLTATPFRLDSGRLHGPGAMFDDVVFEKPVQELIDEGFLSTLTTKNGACSIDLSGVGKVGKEWNAGQLEKAAMQNGLTEHAIQDAVMKAKDRKKWLVFCCGVAHAEEVKESLTAHGIKADVITGNTPREKRSELIKAHRTGDLTALVNVDVLTTGYNNPGIDCLVLLRPTESASLYVQCVGRGMRRHPDKKDCLVLDYAGVVMRHGPIDAITIDWTPGSGEGVAPSKICPECESIIAAGFRECPDCGFIFPPPEIKFYKTAQEAPILKKQIESRWLTVDSVKYFVHKKPGRPDSVRCQYQCGLEVITEWIFPKSESNGMKWHYSQHCKGLKIEPPKTSAEWVFIKEKPTMIEVKPDGKYEKVTRRRYGL